MHPELTTPAPEDPPPFEVLFFHPSISPPDEHKLEWLTLADGTAWFVVALVKDGKTYSAHIELTPGR